MLCWAVPPLTKTTLCDASCGRGSPSRSPPIYLCMYTRPLDGSTRSLRFWASRPTSCSHSLGTRSQLPLPPPRGGRRCQVSSDRVPIPRAKHHMAGSTFRGFSAQLPCLGIPNGETGQSVPLCPGHLSASGPGFGPPPPPAPLRAREYSEASFPQECVTLRLFGPRVIQDTVDSRRAQRRSWQTS